MKYKKGDRVQVVKSTDGKYGAAYNAGYVKIGDVLTIKDVTYYSAQDIVIWPENCGSTGLHSTCVVLIKSLSIPF